MIPTTKFKSAIPLIGLAFVAGIVLVLSRCKKDDTVTPLSSSASSGKDVIYSTATSGTQTWIFDKPHCNVQWETVYSAGGTISGLLTGRFNNFDIDLNFDQANPANSWIKAWVQLSTFNTGESGRDAYGKCGPKYVGVTFDTLSYDTATNTVTWTPRASTDTSKFESTSVAAYGDGYIANGNFTFLGKTLPVKLYFTYSGRTTSTDGKYERCGFSGFFEFNAISDYGCTSTSIADKVKVIVNANYKYTF